MVNKDVLAAIDKEIARLQQARDILSGGESTTVVRGRRAVKAPAKKRGPAAGVKRVLSAEARKRIAEAQKKRWAAQKAAK